VYWDTGSGFPVVFLHGLPTSKELWTHMIDGFHSFRVIVPDLMQYGESEQVDTDFTHKERANNLKEMLDLLQIETIHLVGHDLGSSVAIDFLGMYGELVDKFVIMSPPVYPDFKPPLLVKLNRLPVLGPFMIRFFVDLMFNIGIKRGLTDKSRFTEEMRLHFNKRFRDALGRKTLYKLLRWGEPETEFADYPEIISHLTQETLVVHGKKDPYIPLEHSRRLARDISNARLEIIENGSHFLPLDYGTEIRDLILAFLE
jgi:pimeloyl-ACP methyl ester carboxylesterase